MSRALNELFGQFDRIQRSLIFIHVGLEQGADQLYISPVRATQVKGSIRPIHRKANFLIFVFLATGPHGRCKLRPSIGLWTGLSLQIAALHRHTRAAANICLIHFRECP
jgi:hypothetical protein